MENLTINGRYKILQQIGVGGFGLTYLAEDLHLQTRPKCVVKHLKPQINDAETMRLANRLFGQEAEVLYRLGGHPNIPSLIAHFKEKGEFFLVQEFIEGHTISQEFTGGRRYNQKEIIQLLGQTLEILSFVHSQKVIHRDIKPANLIRRVSDSSIFLIDFGAVKQVNAVPRTPNSSTFSTVTIGSHGYMPMEQLAGNPNFSSDLFALGLVAIEALTGIKPLDLPKNQTTNEFIWNHKAQLSPEVEHFITKLVRFDFRQRYFSANEALAGLNAIASRAGFFNARPQTLTIQPINQNQNFQPNNLPPQIIAPINNPSFIPPTIIVPTQNYSANMQNPPIQEPRPTSPVAKLLFAGIIGLCCFIGFLFIVGKVLNFRRNPIEVAEKNNKQNPRNEETTLSKDSSNSLYNEAIKQAQEAAQIERKATTKFEWEEVGNKYKRAFALLSSIDSTSPEYASAQERIDEYKRKSDYAFQKSLNPNENLVVNTDNPANAPLNTVPSPYPNSNSATTNSKPTKVNLTMPSKQSAQNYLSYNYYDGYEVKQFAVSSNEALFTSKVERYSYEDKDTKTVFIKVEGGNYLEIKFRPPVYTSKLTAGNYPSARELSSQITGNYSISFSKLSCYQDANHSFTINSIVYNELYANVSLLDATFILSCGNRKLMGRVHYDAR